MPPLKLEKIRFFGVKSRFFTRNTPKNFAPPSARHNFFKCNPPNLKSWIRPCIGLLFFYPHYIQFFVWLNIIFLIFKKLIYSCYLVYYLHILSWTFICYLVSYLYCMLIWTFDFIINLYVSYILFYWVRALLWK
jgi:hypothetical protein